MKTKTIWIWAVIFGLVSTGAVYFTLFSKPDKQSLPLQPKTDPSSKTAGAKTDLGATDSKADDPKIGLPLAQGKRAVSVAVNEVQGVSGFLTPGAYVDVIAIVSPTTGDNVSSQLLLQNIKILAVGSMLDSSDPAANQSSKKEQQKNAPYRTVTLEINPAEGTALALAGQKGTVTFMLRAPGDFATNTASYLTQDKLYKGEIAK